jgi:predicted enzyme related to lactoylglutathione lyase
MSFFDRWYPQLGVMDGAAMLPEEVPSQWSIFFGAEDVDKTVQVITENGGAVLRGAEDTPYGRLASATDPTGVTSTCLRCSRDASRRGIAWRAGGRSGALLRSHP